MSLKVDFDNWYWEAGDDLNVRSADAGYYAATDRAVGIVEERLEQSSSINARLIYKSLITALKGA